MKEAYYATIEELVEEGKKHIPRPYRAGGHLLYQFPAVLRYRPYGFAGAWAAHALLNIPESVLLLIAPEGCGRSTAMFAGQDGNTDRIFYLTIQGADQAAGRLSEEIPEAVREIVDAADPHPKAVVLCPATEDLLPAAEMESVCRRIKESAGVTAVSCCMYAQRKNGQASPAAMVGRKVYSLLERRQADAKTVNLMGFFSPLSDGCELFSLLQEAGMDTVLELSRMKTMEQYAGMGAAGLNLVLDPDLVCAAEDLRTRLGIPYAELQRWYDPDRIRREYRMFGSAAGVTLQDDSWYEEAVWTRRYFRQRHAGLTAAVGSVLHANPFELAIALQAMGIRILSVFADVTEEDFPYLTRLAGMAPDIRVYAENSPSMIFFDDQREVDLTFGEDAAWYYPEAKHVYWNGEKQPFGYSGMIELIREIEKMI